MSAACDAEKCSIPEKCYMWICFSKKYVVMMVALSEYLLNNRVNR